MVSEEGLGGEGGGVSWPPLVGSCLTDSYGSVPGRGFLSYFVDKEGGDQRLTQPKGQQSPSFCATAWGTLPQSRPCAFTVTPEDWSPVAS